MDECTLRDIEDGRGQPLSTGMRRMLLASDNFACTVIDD